MSSFLLAAALLHPPLQAPACPPERAVYRLHGAPGFSAGFLRQDRRKVSASDLVLWLKTPARTYFFSFQSPNGYGGTYLVPDIDPRAAARLDDEGERDEAERVRAAAGEPVAFDAFAKDLSALKSPPQSDGPAPALLFSRGLGPALWYEPAALAGGDSAAPQESMPVGLFRAAGCGGPPPEENSRRP